MVGRKKQDKDFDIFEMENGVETSEWKKYSRAI